MTSVLVAANSAGKGGLGDERDIIGNGGNGGGIFNSGTLSMTNTRTTENRAGQGGDGACYGLVGDGGDGGSGGGIFNQGQIWIEASQIDHNHSGLGNDPGCYQLLDPIRGDGGGIYNTKSAKLITVTLADNRVGSEHDGSDRGGGVHNIGQLTMSRSNIVDNGARLGGGIYSTSALTLTESIVSGNTVSSTLWSPYPSPPWADPSAGGGAYLSGNATIEGTTIHNNETYEGAPGYEYGYGDDSGNGFDSGSGGGIYSDATLILRNSTVSGNRTGNGGNAAEGVGSQEGGKGGNAGSGGGIASRGQLIINNSTITANSTGVGGNGAGGDISGEDGRGGGLGIDDGQASMRNTILVGNTATEYADCFGVLESSTYNWFGVGQGCTVSGERTNNVSSPLLALSDLGPFGGPTPTHMPLSGSPAVNTGSCLDSEGMPVNLDQRGEPRPQAQLCDIGAVESPHTETTWRNWLPSIFSTASNNH